MNAAHRVSRVLLAAAAGALLGLAATGPAVALADNSGLFPTPTPKAQGAGPTPCTPDLNGLLCSLTGGPTAAPQPPPPPPTAKPAAPPPAAARAGAAPPAAPPPPPAAPRRAAAPQGVTAGVAAAAATFQNAPFLVPLLEILAHPTAAQQPDLVHFRVPASVDADGVPLTAAADPPRVITTPVVSHRGWSVMAALLCALVGGGLAAARTPGGRVAGGWLAPRMRRGARRLHRSRALHWMPQTATGRRLAAGTVVAVLPLVVSAAVAGAAQHRVTSTTPSAVAAVARGAMQSAGHAARVGSSAVLAGEAHQVATIGDLPVWNQLVGIEEGIADQQDRLAAQEKEITRLAAMAGPAGDPASVPPPAGGTTSAAGATAADAAVAPPAVVPAPDPALQKELAALVALHDQTKAQLQASLQAEYDLYRLAAQDPTKQLQLMKGAQIAPIPGAPNAVTDDLGRLQAQLSEEKVISDARAHLGAIGSLEQKQLDAIQHHQAFITPEVAPLTQTFGPTDFSMEPPITIGGVFYSHFHTGIDLGGALDTPVHAAADGVVIVAGASTDGAGNYVGYGNYVVIAHPDGFLTLYGHLDNLAVRQGQVVHQGEIVGREGSTGWSTGPHLHFEIRHDNGYVDPLPYVRAQLGL